MQNNRVAAFLLATVITWGRFLTPARGAAAAATVAFLTEVYFLFTQYALFKTMDLVSAIADTIMWTLVNAVVGALVARILARSYTPTADKAGQPQLSEPRSVHSHVTAPATSLRCSW